MIESELTLPCPAKVNLFLEVLGKRDDGFHDIVSVFQEIDLEDTLHARPDDEISLDCNTNTIPTDDTNLVIRAAHALRRATGTRQGIKYYLEKAIPAKGGLGGGSSDAATALIAANHLWRTGLTRPELAEIGASIGSDIPFFLYGGTCLCEGRGERVTPLYDCKRGLNIGLILPPWGITTADAFQALQHEALGTHKIEPFLEALRVTDVEAIAKQSFNRFENVVSSIEPRQKEIFDEVRARTNACLRLSGSGSCLWSLPRNVSDAVALGSVTSLYKAQVLSVHGHITPRMPANV